MPGLILILASAPWGPVRIETAADLGDAMAHGMRPAYSADVGGRDLEQVAAVVRSRLPPADGFGAIVVDLDRATAAVAGAFSAIPAVVIPPKLENAAGESACKPEAMVDRHAGQEVRDQYALARDIEPVRPARPRRVGPEVDVREIRSKLKLTQDGFAKAFGFAVATVRDWEQGRKAPDTAARSLLMVIAFRPNVVKEALGRYGVAVEG